MNWCSFESIGDQYWLVADTSFMHLWSMGIIAHNDCGNASIKVRMQVMSLRAMIGFGLPSKPFGSWS